MTATATRDAIDLDALDAEIARLRGWVRRKRTGGILLPGDLWIPPNEDEGRAAGCTWGAHDAGPLSLYGLIDTRAPRWSREWALAGVLFVEMPRPSLALVIGDSDWRSWFCEAHPEQPTEQTAQFCATPTIAAARAWLAWARAHIARCPICERCKGWARAA